MASSNATLTSLWVDDGQGSPMKVIPVGRALSNGSELKEDIMKFYKESGLEPVAKEAGILDTNGEIATYRDQNTLPKGAVQMIAVPVASPGKSPFKVEQQILPRQIITPTPGSPMILSTPHRIITSHVVSSQSPRNTHLITPILESPQWSAGRKRSHELVDDYSDGKRGKKGEKGGKGLRHFSMKVCEKVQKKGLTSYNEVADELVGEFSDPRNMMPSDQIRYTAYDQKNIRRRVYDALNVLMAMNIISKEKKEIRWIGLPTNSAQECQNLELEKQRRLDRIKHKTQQLQELILQQIAFKNLVQRNKQLESTQGAPTSNSSIQLPFIIVNTSKKTVIDCSISNDKYEYLFNFDNTFEIHDDIEVLKRMGMAYGLEKGICGPEELRKAVKMVPKALEPYVLQLAKVAQPGMLPGAGTSVLPAATASTSQYKAGAMVPMASTSMMSLDQSADAEVALATAHGLSRQSSIASFSDVGVASRDSPFSDEESESERSSPVDIS